MVQIHLPRCFGGNDDIVVVRGSVPVCYAVSVGVNVVSEVVTIIDGTRQRGARRCRIQLNKNAQKRQSHSKPATGS